MYVYMLHAQKFPFSRSTSDDVRDGDGGIAICKVWVIDAATDCDAKAIPRFLQRHVTS